LAWAQGASVYALTARQRHQVRRLQDPNDGLDPGQASELPAAKGTTVSYYRPSGSKGFFIYNGIVQQAFRVRFPS